MVWKWFRWCMCEHVNIASCVNLDDWWLLLLFSHVFTACAGLLTRRRWHSMEQLGQEILEDFGNGRFQKQGNVQPTFCLIVPATSTNVLMILAVVWCVRYFVSISLILFGTVRVSLRAPLLACFEVMYDKLTCPDDSDSAPRLEALNLDSAWAPTRRFSVWGTVEARIGRDPREDCNMFEWRHNWSMIYPACFEWKQSRMIQVNQKK